MSSKRTADFIVALSQHPDKKAAYQKDPETAMKAAGLSEEAKAALRSGDPDKVFAHLGDDATPGCVLVLP